MALSAGSVAINAGSVADAPATDQRRGTRDVLPDIGAYEYSPAVPTVTTSSPASISTVSAISEGDVIGDAVMVRGVCWSESANVAPGDDCTSDGSGDGGGTGCAIIYYTTDGGNPTTDSAQYTVPLVLDGDAVVKFCSQDIAGNVETVKTQTYQISTASPTWLYLLLLDR